ncbi:hypothetical protein [Flavobacterium sp. DSP2-3-1]|uniref:hypothetical protein n=1 Tax=Flavobacterium sp. DSP2-3-1 TaxID=2804620 RepID=UPI003CF32319
MANFTREDLAFNGYSQKIDLTNNSDCTEIFDHIYIDKTEEFQIIHFCNQFLEKYKVPQTKASFQKVESFLQHPELENEDHKDHLQDWIASNWIKI